MWRVSASWARCAQIHKKKGVEGELKHAHDMNEAVGAIRRADLQQKTKGKGGVIEPRHE